MKKALLKPSDKSERGFTLLELLIVITIIGILAGLAFPAFGVAQKNAAKTHATNTCHQLKNAITTYHTEYRRFPVSGSSEGDEQARSDSEIMDVLLAANQELNPRGIVFYSGRPAKGNKKGITLSGENGGGQLWDPWGQHYYVTMDTDSNGRVTKPDWDNTVNSSVLPSTVIVWSSGADEDNTTRQDNAASWK